ncbi:MAG: TonB-dependent receptor, partial [Cytophagales bacterium]|nr:TonB-dependent receptor [Cytophagales bacterium]
ISAPGAFFARETTQKSDKYTASSSYHAGYLMFDSRFSTKIRAIWGLRLEAFNQKLSSPDLQKPVDTTWVDPLPSANIIYSLNDKINLRASYSRTVSRPEFREFAPLGFYEFSMNSIFVGNPSLNRSTIHNIDLKFEIYPTAGSFFAITPFYKYFYNPIISVRAGGNTIFDTYNYDNAKSAINYGVEIEGRSKFSVFSKAAENTLLDKFTLFANLALINSALDLSNIAVFNGTDIKNIPLTGQSPYVFNAGLQYSDDKTGWDFTATGNIIGRRLAYVGRNSTKENIWENPRFVLDLSVTKTIKKVQIRGILSDLLAQDLVFYYDLNNNGSFDKNTDLAAFKYKNGQRFVLQAILNF